MDEMDEYYDDQRPELIAEELPSVFPDITTISQPAIASTICRIDYHPDFVAAHDYLRALLQRETPNASAATVPGEMSLRALRLTRLCLSQNSSNYTTWHYRRRILQHLFGFNSNLAENNENNCTVLPMKAIQYEFLFVTSLAGSNPKNYQIWYHIRILFENVLQQPEESPSDNANSMVMIVINFYTQMVRPYLDTVFAMDGKNYHAWSLRQWIVSQIQAHCLAHAETTVFESMIWQPELDYTSEWICTTDARNNSAWNHRWCLLHLQHGGPLRVIKEARGRESLPMEVTQSEIDFAFTSIKAVDAQNESSWVYLLALLREQYNMHSNEAQVREMIVYCLEELLAIQRQLVTLSSEEQAGPEGNEEDGLKEVEASAASPLSYLFDVNCRHLLGTALEILAWLGEYDDAVRVGQLLATKYDKIRTKYWQYKVQQIKLQASTEPKSS
jgi:protein farnesyltransferase/geranylgeranyltransferase type-1 subunit alpha